MNETNVHTLVQGIPERKQRPSRRTCLALAVAFLGTLLFGMIFLCSGFFRSSEAASFFVRGLASDPVADAHSATDDFYNAMIRHNFDQAHNVLGSNTAATYSVAFLKN